MANKVPLTRKQLKELELSVKRLVLGRLEDDLATLIVTSLELADLRMEKGSRDSVHLFKVGKRIIHPFLRDWIADELADQVSALVEDHLDMQKLQKTV